MKKYLLMAAMIAGVLSFSSCGPTQVVASRPADVVYTRPVAPGADYIWINGDWYWSGGRYTWHEGRWDRPRPGRVWNEGGWYQQRGGWRWRRGHWR